MNGKKPNALLARFNTRKVSISKKDMNKEIQGLNSLTLKERRSSTNITKLKPLVRISTTTSKDVSPLKKAKILAQSQYMTIQDTPKSFKHKPTLLVEQSEKQSNLTGKPPMPSGEPRHKNCMAIDK